MKCPRCSIDLVMSDRQGVEIDYCSQCRGVWLDRGELDKIIERSATYSRQRDDDDDDDDYRRYPQGHRPREGEEYKYDKRRKRGWLGELFEFGD